MSAKYCRATRCQSLPLNGRNTGQLTLLLPGTITYNPRGFTNIGSVNMNRPFVNGNREQTNNFTVDGFDVNETIDNRVAYQPIPDAARRDQRRDQQLRGRRRQRRRRGDQQRRSSRGRTSSAATRSSSIATATSTRTPGRTIDRARRSRSASSTFSAGRSAARIVANACSSLAIIRGRGRTRPGFGTASVAPEAWRRGDLSSVTDHDPRSAHRPAVSRQSDSRRSHQPDGARAAERPDQLPAAQPHRARRRFRQLRRRDGCSRSGRTRATSASTGAPRTTTSSSAATRSRLYEDERDIAAVPAGAADAQRSAVLQRRRQLESHLRPVARERAARRLQQHQGRGGDVRLGRRRHRQRRSTGLPADSRSPASARSAGAAASRCRAPSPPTRTRWRRRIRSTRRPPG